MNLFKNLLTIMILKTIGIYALTLSILGNLIYIYIFFSWNRSLLFVVINVTLIGIATSIIGIIFDSSKFKLISLISLLLCFIPYLIIWIIHEPGG